MRVPSRPKYHRILCAIDFSETSAPAFDRAVDWAIRTEAALTLVHVQPKVHYGRTGDELERRSLEDALADEDSRMADWMQVARAQGVGHVDFVSPEGRPADQILALVEKGRYHLVVIGTHGRSGVARAWLGSVAEEVVRHASCPVLVAR